MLKIKQTTYKDIKAGDELSDAVDKIHKNFKKQEIYKKGGVMGLITKDNLPRYTAYSHGVFFAFAPFVSDKNFWD